MKRNHPIVISLATAAAAAVVVIAVYLLINEKGKNKQTPQQPPAVAAQNADASKTAAKANAKAKNVNPTNLPAPPPPPPSMSFNGGKPPQLPDNLPNAEEMREQFSMLRRFLELSPERLKQIRESIERIERMPPERKKMMLERIQNVDPTPLGTQSSAIQPVLDAPEHVRTQVSAILEAMPVETRTALLSKLSSFSQEQRNAFFEGMAMGASPAVSPDSMPMPWNAPKSDDPFGK